MKQLNIPPRERAIVDAFKEDLPEILEGRDPFVPGDVPLYYPYAPDLSPKVECAYGPCTNAAFQRGLCHKHYGIWRRYREPLKASQK